MAAEHGKVWRLKPGHVDDFVDTMTRRITCLNRVVSQGCIKSPDVPWVLELPWNKGTTPVVKKPAADVTWSSDDADDAHESLEEEEASDTDDGTKSTEEVKATSSGSKNPYDIGFSTEHLLPRRCLKGVAVKMENILSLVPWKTPTEWATTISSRRSSTMVL